ncbi:MAG: hypothetical protein HFG02_01665 [Oscillibacter sp.]|nr:hypothetical protein [Oscillibacter sp.]
MLKLLGSLLIACGGAFAWQLQRTERRRRRDTLSDLQRAFRRMGETVRMTRTPLPALLKSLAADCKEPVAAFFTAVSQAAGEGEELSKIWREQAETLPLNAADRAAVLNLVFDLQGDEEKVCKAISLVARELTEHAGEAERLRPETEKRAAALWFSAAALLVILLL